MDMRLLIIGTGGVGTSAAKIIKRAGKEGEWAEKVVLSDYNLARAEAVAKELDDPRFVRKRSMREILEASKQWLRSTTSLGSST